MKLYWPHIAQTNIWHNQAGSKIESAGQKEGGKTSETLIEDWRSVEEELRESNITWNTNL